MNLLKQSSLELTRHPVKSVVLFLVFLLNFTGIFSSLVLQSSAQTAEERLLNQIGATVTLDYGENYDAETDNPNIFTQEVIEQLSGVEYVVGSNQHYSDYVLPQSFQNCRQFEGEDPSQQSVQMDVDAETADYVVLDGNTDLSLTDLFRNGNASLVDGQMPSTETPGAVLSQQLAEDNGLRVGDSISISVDQKEYSIPVIGIYQTSAAFVISEDNAVGEAVFAYSPYNRIYTDLDTISSVFGIDPDSLYVNFYIDQPGHVQLVGEAMKAMELDWTQYTLVNTTQTSYNLMASQISGVNSMAGLLLVLISAIAMLSIILVTSIWAERSRYESGIFLALGTSRWYALLQQFLTTICAAIPALVFSVLLAQPVAGLLLQLKSAATIQGSGTVSQFETGLEINLQVEIVSPGVQVYAVYFLCILAAVVIACLVPAWCVLRLKPREILSKK